MRALGYEYPCQNPANQSEKGQSEWRAAAPGERVIHGGDRSMHQKKRGGVSGGSILTHTNMNKNKTVSQPQCKYSQYIRVLCPGAPHAYRPRPAPQRSHGFDLGLSTPKVAAEVKWCVWS